MVQALNFYNLSEMLDVLDDEEMVISDLIQDIYYLNIVANLVKRDIKFHELEGYDDISSNAILVAKFQDEQGASTIIDLLIENNQSHDLARFIAESYENELSTRHPIE